ncbi:MAG: hypothetical protein AB8B79_11145 [Granulosicoccus sp.]
MLRPIIFVSLSAALLISIHSQPSRAQAVEVFSQQGLLTVKANNTTAQQLADALNDQLDISVVVAGDTEALVNIDIVEEPLEVALGKLSPNNMLVRAGKDSDSEIVEVVLLMGEGSSSTAAASSQFLPSGSPAEEVANSTANTAPLQTDASVLRDPNRAQRVRDAAAAASNDAGGLPAARQPNLNDPSILPIDPATGLPMQPQ